MSIFSLQRMPLWECDDCRAVMSSEVINEHTKLMGTGTVKSL